MNAEAEAQRIFGYSKKKESTKMKKMISLLAYFLVGCLVALHAQTISLERGWNLIGSSKNMTNLESELSKVRVIWKYQDGKWCVRSADPTYQAKLDQIGFSRLQEIGAGEGFWVYETNSSATFEIKGAEPEDYTIDVKRGWQLLSPLTESGIQPSDLNDSSVKSIWKYRNGKWEAWSPDPTYNDKLKALFNPVEKINTGEGFWLYANNTQSFEFATPPEVPNVGLGGAIVSGLGGESEESAETKSLKGLDTDENAQYASLIIDSNKDGQYDPESGDKLYTAKITNNSFSFNNIELPSGETSAEVLVKIDLPGYAPYEKKVTVGNGISPSLTIKLEASALTTTTIKLGRSSERAGHYLTFLIKKGKDGKRYVTAKRTTSPDAIDVSTESGETQFAASYDESLFGSDVEAVTFTGQPFNSLNPNDLEFFPGSFDGTISNKALKRMGRSVKQSDGEEKVKLESVAFSYTKLTDQNGNEITFDKNATESRVNKDVNFSDCRIVIDFRLNSKQAKLVEEKGDADPNTTDYEVPMWGYTWGSSSWEYLGMGVYNDETHRVKTCIVNPRIRSYHNIDYFRRITAGDKPKAVCIQTIDQLGNPVVSLGFKGEEVGVGNDVVSSTSDENGFAKFYIPSSKDVTDYNITYSKYAWDIPKTEINASSFVTSTLNDCDFEANLTIANPFAYILRVHTYERNGSIAPNRGVTLRNSGGKYYWSWKRSDDNGVAEFKVKKDTDYYVTAKASSSYANVDNNKLDNDKYHEMFDNGELVDVNLTEVEKAPTAYIWGYPYEVPEQLSSVIVYFSSRDVNKDDINISKFSIDGVSKNLSDLNITYEYYSKGYLYIRANIDISGLPNGEHNISAIYTDGVLESKEAVWRFNKTKNRAPRVYSVYLYDEDGYYANPNALRPNKVYEVRAYAYDPDGDDFNLTYEVGPNDQSDKWITFYQDGEYNLTVIARDHVDVNGVDKSKTGSKTIKVFVGNRDPYLGYIYIPNKVVKALPFKASAYANDMDSEDLNVTVDTGEKNVTMDEKKVYRNTHGYYTVYGSYEKEFNLSELGKHTFTFTAVDSDGGKATRTKEIEVLESKVYFIRKLPESQSIDINRITSRRYCAYAYHIDGWRGARKITYKWEVNGIEIDETGRCATIDFSQYENGDKLIVKCTASAGAYGATTEMSVTVTDSDRPPVVKDIDDIVLNQDFKPYTIYLNGRDPDGTDLQWSAVVGSNTPSTSAVANDTPFTIELIGRKLILKSVTGRYGEDNVTVWATSNGKKSNEVTFKVTVKKINHAPIIAAIPDVKMQSTDVNKSVRVEISATDPDGDTLTYGAAITDNPSLAHIKNINGNKFDIVLDKSIGGRAIIEVNATDSGGLSVSRRFALIVKDNNPPALAISDDINASNGLILEEGFGTHVLHVKVDNKDDLSGYATLVVATSFDAPFNVTVKGNRIVVQEKAHRFGSGWVKIYAIKFSNKKDSSRTITIEVKNVDDPPYFISPKPGSTIRFLEDFGVRSLNVKVDDPDNDPTSLALVNYTPKGIVDINLSGKRLTISSKENKFGKVVVELNVTSVHDGATKWASESFNIDVLPVDDAPVLSPISDVNLTEDFNSYSIALNAVDPDGDPITYSVKTLNNTAGVKAYIVGNRLQLQSSKDKSGSADINVIASSKGKSDSKMFHVVVSPVDDPPYIEKIDDLFLLDTSEATTVNVVAHDVDSDESVIQYSLVKDGVDESGRKVVNATISGNAITITPMKGITGVGIIEVKAISGAKSATETFYVTVSSAAAGNMRVQLPFEGAIVAMHDPKTLKILKDASGNQLVQSTDANGSSKFSVPSLAKYTISMSILPTTVLPEEVMFAGWVERIGKSVYGESGRALDSDGRSTKGVSGKPVYSISADKIACYLSKHGKDANVTSYDNDGDDYLNSRELYTLSADLYDENNDSKLSVSEFFHIAGGNYSVFVEDVPVGIYKFGLNDLFGEFMDADDTFMDTQFKAPDGHHALAVTLKDMDENDAYVSWSGSGFGFSPIQRDENNETVLNVDLTTKTDDGGYALLFALNGREWNMVSFDANRSSITISAKDFKDGMPYSVDYGYSYDKNSSTEQKGYEWGHVWMEGKYKGLTLHPMYEHTIYVDSGVDYMGMGEFGLKDMEYESDHVPFKATEIPTQFGPGDLDLLDVSLEMIENRIGNPGVRVTGAEIDRIDGIGSELDISTEIRTGQGAEQYSATISVFDTNGTHTLPNMKYADYLPSNVAAEFQKARKAFLYVKTGMKRGESEIEKDVWAFDLKEINGSDIHGAADLLAALPKINEKGIRSADREKEYHLYSDTTKTLGIFTPLHDVVVDVNETATMYIEVENTLPNSNVSYEWKIDGNVVSGTVGDTLTYTPSEKKTYHVECEVSNGQETLSSKAAIRVKDTVTGVVQVDDATVASGAHVRLYSKDDNGALYDKTVVTDDEGRYTFDDVPSGIYYLVVAADGYAPSTTVLEVNEQNQ